MTLRSLLFAPADSERKLAKAIAAGADAVILDLEDSVAPERKPAAREILRSFLFTLPAGQRSLLFVRINPLRSGEALADLAAVAAMGLRGIMLPKAAGIDDVVQLSHYLDMAEAMAGRSAGTLAILPVVTETARAVQLADTLTQGPQTARLAALTWGGEDLATDIGARSNKGPDGNWDDVFRYARSRCLLAAAACAVPAIDTLFANYRDEAGLRRACEEARRSGFGGKIAIHPEQVAVINAAFTPSADEIAQATAIVDAFAAQPEAGVVGIGGAMYDRPHLLLARRILAAAAGRRAE